MDDQTERYYWRPVSLNYLTSNYAFKNVRLYLPVFIWIAFIIAATLIIYIFIPLDWLSIATNELHITQFFIIYPALLLGILLLFWFGFEWSCISAYIFSFMLAFQSGMELGASLLFGLSFVFGLTIFGLAYRSSNVPYDLKGLKSIFFFIAIGFIAALASSLGAFIWSLSHQLNALNTINIWKGWWTGTFLQTVFITGPLLYMLTPAIERIKSKYYTLGIKGVRSVAWSYGAVVYLTVVLALFIVAAKWLHNRFINEAVNALPVTSRTIFGSGLTSFDIFFWFSIGLILLTAFTAIFLIGNRDKQLKEQAEMETRQQQEREQNLQQSLNEKKLLLQEIHHRIKNDLAQVSSLLELQQLTIDNDYYSGLIEESKSRIRTMVLVHEALYQTEDFKKISLKEHLKKICRITHQSFLKKDVAVKMKYDLIEFPITSNQAIPIGLIACEGIMNAHKYAFEGRQEGSITVSLEKMEEGLLLTIADNGIGMQEEATRHSSLGMELIESFSRQLSGKLRVESGEGGTKITVHFTLKD